MSIYGTLIREEDIIEASQTVITTALWSNNTGSLEGNALFLNDTQVGNSGEYYLDVYNQDPNIGSATEDTAEIQFAIAYGNISGSGAPTLENDEQAKLPTAAVYSQYRNLLLDPTDSKFTFENVESDHIYVINFSRARFKEQLDPGNWELPLSGANGIHTFIDDSNQRLGSLTANSRAGRVFKVVSGSIATAAGIVTASSNATTWGTNGPGYGYVYPDLGIIVLNPNAIGPAVGFYTSGSALAVTASADTGSTYIGASPIYDASNVATLDTVDAVPFAPLVSSLDTTTWSSEKAAYNHAALFVSLRKALTDFAEETEFRARSAETISSQHYFIRLRNRDFNYSNNPTFRDQDDNTLVIPEFNKDPKVYITTVGLYNDNNELLAVAKLSKPVRKSFNEEILLRVRLDF